jgi:hypothetical protein
MKLRKISRHITPWWPGNAKIKRDRREAEEKGMKYVETPEYVRPPVAALTDKAGAGKTFVALSLVCKDIEEGRLGCTVVVVPKRSSCSGNPPSRNSHPT